MRLRLPLLSGFCMVVLIVITAKPVERDDNPVLLRLVMPEPTVCVGSKTIEAEVELRNVSGQPLGLTVAGIGYSVHFRAVETTGESGGVCCRSSDSVGDPWPDTSPGKLTILQPGQSYHTKRELGLDDKFFSWPGIYKVSIDYSGRFKPPARDDSSIQVFDGFLESNWVLFELQACNSPSEE